MKHIIRERPSIDVTPMILIQIPGSYYLPNPEIFTGLHYSLSFPHPYFVASSFRVVVTKTRRPYEAGLYTNDETDSKNAHQRPRANREKAICQKAWRSTSRQF
jgi:hypothetical protein